MIESLLDLFLNKLEIPLFQISLFLISYIFGHHEIYELYEVLILLYISSHV